MKNTRSLIGWFAVFVAGFLCGVVFSAWKLDKTEPPSAKARMEADDKTRSAELPARIAGLEKMIAADPNNVQALIQLGNDYFDGGNHDKAVEAYQKALKLDPRNADVLTDMGASFRKLGKTNECIAAFRQALEVAPEHALALFNLGLVLRDDAKDYPEALKTWERFLEIAGNSPHAVMVRPWVNQLKKKLGGSAEPEMQKP